MNHLMHFSSIHIPRVAVKQLSLKAILKLEKKLLKCITRLIFMCDRCRNHRDQTEMVSKVILGYSFEASNQFEKIIQSKLQN